MIIHEVPNLFSEHREAKGEKGFLHGHKDLAAIGKQSINAFRVLRAIDGGQG